MSMPDAIDDLLADVIQFLLADEALGEDTSEAGDVPLDLQLTSSIADESGATPVT
jgi:hypothetical protein